ncbi:hypothetical protein MUK42_26186 [Musa troglodytarum]|uniref:Uncharacterized protein n=1 Tax=Musa troglodytarum TaxID=320322 RepID=A0A9E7L4T4_9LILI|nr:hypothetical protein MUK42_26186 [Musa troglodytarum]
MTSGTPGSSSRTVLSLIEHCDSKCPHQILSDSVEEMRRASAVELAVYVAAVWSTSDHTDPQSGTLTGSVHRRCVFPVRLSWSLLQYSTQHKLEKVVSAMSHLGFEKANSFLSFDGSIRRNWGAQGHISVVLLLSNNYNNDDDENLL